MLILTKTSFWSEYIENEVVDETLTTENGWTYVLGAGIKQKCLYLIIIKQTNIFCICEKEGNEI